MRRPFIPTDDDVVGRYLVFSRREGEPCAPYVAAAKVGVNCTRMEELTSVSDLLVLTGLANAAVVIRDGTTWKHRFARWLLFWAEDVR